MSTTRLQPKKSRRNSIGVPRIESTERSSDEPSSDDQSNSDKGNLSRERRSRSPGSNGDDLRYHLASLVRLSDNIVAKAVRAYDRLFALDVRDQAEIHLQMGADLAKDGNVRGAIEALRKAAHLRPEDGEICLQLGKLYLHRRNAPEAALREFVAAGELGIDHAELRLLKAESLKRLDRNGEAVAELEKALELDPTAAEASYLLGVALDAAGDFHRAVEAFQRAINIDPGQIAYHQNLGLTLESAGKRREAIRCFKRALELERQQVRSS